MILLNKKQKMLLRLDDLNLLKVNPEFVFDKKAEDYMNRFLTKFVIWIISLAFEKKELKKILKSLLGEESKYLISEGEKNEINKSIEPVLDNYRLGYFVSGMLGFIIETCKVDYNSDIIVLDTTGKTEEYKIVSFSVLKHNIKEDPLISNIFDLVKSKFTN